MKEKKKRKRREDKEKNEIFFFALEHLGMRIMKWLKWEKAMESCMTISKSCCSYHCVEERAKVPNPMSENILLSSVADSEF